MSHGKIALLLGFLGAIAIIGYRVVEPMLDSQQQLAISDAAASRGEIRIAVDGWVGYFPLCSPEMKKRLRNQGYGLTCVDDNADYNARFSGLKKGKYEFAVATVDSYLLNAKSLDYPGQIVAVLDESKGGDALVAWDTKFSNLDAFKQNPLFSIAFTPNSPSHHLLKVMASHFDIASFRDEKNARHSDGSEAALNLLLNKKVDAAVLWEPDVSKALQQKGVVKILSTADTQHLIVDVLIANHDVLRKDPELVNNLLQTYFTTLQAYRREPALLAKHLAEHYDIDSKHVAPLTEGVRWLTLQDNAADWFSTEGGIGKQYLVESIESALDVLIESKDFDRNPIPNRDPYRLLSSSSIRDLYRAHSSGTFGIDDAKAVKTFKLLDDNQWSRLKEVGTLKVRPILFSSGTSDLAMQGKEEIDLIIKNLQHYPNFRIEIRGHTGTRGEAYMNQVLSQERADTVLRYLDITYGIDANRVRAIGLGGTKPLAKLPGESTRAYNYRLPRVEIVLVSEVL